ncbi:MAG: hypothetical protein AB8B94_08475 [Hyphomicrobiales bacterium]
MKQLNLAAIISGIALIFSTILSGSGINESLASSELPSYVRIAVSALVTALLTMLSFKCWSLVGKALRERKIRSGVQGVAVPGYHKLVWAAVFFTGMSTFTAFTALTFVNHRDAVQNVLNRQTFAGVVLPMGQLARDYQRMAAIASTARIVAAERSALEAANGGTCGVSRPGRGPIADMRQNHAQHAADLQRDTLELSAEARSLIDRVLAAGEQTAVRQAFSEAVSLSLDPRRSSVSATAQELAAGYAGQGFVVGGRVLECPDNELGTAFRKIATASDQVVELPSIAPTKRSATIFDAFATIYKIIVGHGDTASAGISLVSLAPLLIMAAIFDFIGAAGALVYGRGKAIRLSTDERDHFHRVQWILENFVWSFPVAVKKGENRSDTPFFHQAYLIVPYHGDPRKTRDAEFMASLFELAADPSLQLQPLKAARQEFFPFIDRFRWASGGATHFTAYPINDQATYESIERDKRDARKAIGFDYVLDNDYPDYVDYDDDKVVAFR